MKLSLLVVGVVVAMFMVVMAPTFSSFGVSAIRVRGVDPILSSPKGLTSKHISPLQQFGNMDKMIARESRGLDVMHEASIFDPHVFDYRYYIMHHNLTAAGIVTNKQARAHWAHIGLRQGLRASKLFSVKSYIAHNKDVRDRFGRDGFYLAVAHYVKHGVHDLWRATGGPSRIHIFDPRIFDWKFYVSHNSLAGITTEEAAKNHWSSIGLDHGLQASPDLNIQVYLAHSPDLQFTCKKSYRCALGHWLDRGFSQTWRENGVSSCKYWASWCKGPLLDTLVKDVPVLPVYQPKPLQQTPIPVHAGHAVTINGKQCSDMQSSAILGSDSTRIAEVTKLSWKGHGDSRACEVLVHHYVDIQTRVQGMAPDFLSLKKWHFENTVPAIVTQKPTATPHGYTYKGFSYAFKPTHGAPAATFNEQLQLSHNSDLAFDIMRYRDEASANKARAAPRSPSGQVLAIQHMTHQQAFEIVHHYQISKSAGISSSGIVRNNQEGAVGVTGDMIGIKF